MSNFNVDTLILLTLIVAVFAFLRWMDRQKVIELQTEMTMQRKRYEARIQELERRVDFLVQELQKAGIQIHDLEQQLASHHIVSRETSLPTKPLLLICGTVATMCDADRHALRRAGVAFQRLYHATMNSIEDELRRRRQDGTLYPWLHITAHAGPDGVALADGLATPAWWNERLDGIAVVFLATCSGGAIADQLAGLVRAVVFVHEEIGDRDASDFTYAFWRRMKEGVDPHQAYRQALLEAPQVAEFVDIRIQH
jgi:hypothetical protein